MNTMDSSASYPSILCVNILQYIFHSFFPQSRRGLVGAAGLTRTGLCIQSILECDSEHCHGQALNLFFQHLIFFFSVFFLSTKTFKTQDQTAAPWGEKPEEEN